MATSTKETVLVTVEGVQDTGRNGYWEMEVSEFEEPLATKEQKLIDVIKGLGQGTTAEVVMGVKQNGDFTNRYLNDIKVQPSDGSTPAPAPAVAGPTKRDEREQTQLRIEAQWAIGRAVEAHVASGGSLSDLLDGDVFATLQTVAESFRTASRALAEKG